MQLTEEQRRTIVANTTERYRRLDDLEAVVEGRQYDGRKSWWDDSVPAWERKPCVRYGLVGSAIRDNTSLIAGEARFPRITARPFERDLLDETGMSTEQSALMDAHLRGLIRTTRFRQHCRAQLNRGQGCGTMVGVLGFRAGRPFVELTRAKWVTPELDQDGQVLSVEIRYTFLKSIPRDNGREDLKVYVFRRRIDRIQDECWEGEARPDGHDPEWTSLGKPTLHRLGFCPVIWAPFDREGATHNEIDGKAIHNADTTELLGNLDIALSQRHRSALYLEPQWVETGVRPGYNPTEPGRAPLAVASVQGGAISAKNPATGGYEQVGGGGRRATRKKGPGYPWQYEDPAVKVQLLQASADALSAISDHCSDLEAKLAEALAVIFLDPNKVKFASSMSGRALKMLRQRQIDRADEIRDDFGEVYILPVISMLLRIEAVCMARGEIVRVPGARQVKGLLLSFLGPATTDEDGTTAHAWTPPDLTLVWGTYTDPDPTENKAVVETVMAALNPTSGRPVLPLPAAVQALSNVFAFEDPAAVLAQLEAEQEEREQKQQEQFERQAEQDVAMLHKAADRVNGKKNGQVSKSERPDTEGAARRERPGETPG